MNHPTGHPVTPGAWVIGGGSGIGRATALRLARDGYRVAVSGRREALLAETVAAITDAGGQAVAVPVDVTDDASVTAAYAAVTAGAAPLEVLVCSAGTNVPNRWWADLTGADFARVVDTNLNAVVRCVLAVLPGFRTAGFGQLIIVSSWAGRHYMSAAGAAYSGSKTALGALVETLNDQEGRSGIRATHLCPGEVDTPILRTRPVPPPDEEIARMLVPADVADVIASVTALPRNVCVNEMVVTPVWNRMYVDHSAYPPSGG
ncbi:SDR family oxidoreductase [Streptomyces paludis]|uniref:SDR family NAD(P)-dependent oxidoreductase n=1 Tax=Streptomyces paludis TaxID=2282738 RepID=A0A345HXT0_9ACTN|nr:SDR family oxidoreductase [Streptomyces paludis]AXG81504.1 SDR family NAD(P)-dependent oxidoreductase [Streptomyces paludis]